MAHSMVIGLSFGRLKNHYGFHQIHKTTWKLSRHFVICVKFCKFIHIAVTCAWLSSWCLLLRWPEPRAAAGANCSLYSAGAQSQYYTQVQTWSHNILQYCRPCTDQIWPWHTLYCGELLSRTLVRNPYNPFASVSDPKVISAFSLGPIETIW